MYLLYNKKLLDTSTADGCNLWELLQAGLGNHATDPQVPLDEIVQHVRAQMESK